MAAVRHLLFAIFFCACWSQLLSCMPSTASKRVTIGAKTYVCLYVGPLNWNSSGEYVQLSTSVTADQLSVIKIPHSWMSTDYKNDTLMQKLGISNDWTPGSGIGVTVGSMGLLSYQRVFREVLTDRTPAPTTYPSSSPSGQPSSQPTSQPSSYPTHTRSPTIVPTQIPSIVPTVEPTVSQAPIEAPSPLSVSPSIIPSIFPTATSSELPSLSPTVLPTVSPSLLPAIPPTMLPSISPTEVPTLAITMTPTLLPTVCPSEIPSLTPTMLPTVLPSEVPSLLPTFTPTEVPTRLPTEAPTEAPSLIPTMPPSLVPTEIPTAPTVRRLASSNHSPSSNHTEKTVTFPMMMAIIYVENGKVKSIVWDNFCHWCSANKCLPSTVNYDNDDVPGDGSNCFVYDHQCIHSSPKNATINSLCELTVYVAWHGTDSTGSNFVSAASRFSRWSTTQISNFTSSLSDSQAYVSWSVREANQTAPNVTSTVRV